MKSVLISIQPKWVEKIASGQKTIEVRKTKPKLETPFKCYIYQTQSKDNAIYKQYKVNDIRSGKVIGEFVCDKIENFRFDALEITYMSRKFRDEKLVNEEVFKGTQVTYKEAYDYCEGMTFDENSTDNFYGWHISNLKIYDKPKELSELWVVKCTNKRGSCIDCQYKPTCMKRVARPPQSYFYVEEL